MDEPQYIRDIKHCYGQQLDSVEAELVQEWHWEEWKPTRFSAKFLRPFVGLKTILHLIEDKTLKLAEESEAGRVAFVAIVDQLKASTWFSREMVEGQRRNSGAPNEFRP
jgi:hypothetical protein